MSPEPVRVLVLYSHALMGEGLGRMLAAEPDLIVDAVDSTDADAVDAAIALEPAVIVVEEGGAVDAAEIVRRSQCPVVLDVDITTTNAWSLRRETISSRPEEFLAAIRGIAAAAPDPDDRDRGGRGGRGDQAEARRQRKRATDTDRHSDSEPSLRTVILPG